MNRADLKPCPVNPFRATLPRQLAQDAERLIASSQSGECPTQAVSCSIRQPAAWKLRQRAFVRDLRRGEILEPEADVSQVSPSVLECRMIDFGRSESFEGLSGRRQVTHQVGKLSQPIACGQGTRIRGCLFEEALECATSVCMSTLVETGIAKPEESVDPI